MLAHSFNSRTTNKGSVLAISLVILTAITLVSVTAMQRSGLQGRMVGSLQQNKIAFHTTNSELEEIYDFYGSQGSATEALSEALNNFTVVDKDQKDDAGNIIKDASGNAITKEGQEFSPVLAGHKSTYTTHKPSSGSHPARLILDSEILHTGVRSSLVEGFSIGSFVEYGFISTSISKEPSILSNRQLSSQSIGIKYIAPAG